MACRIEREFLTATANLFPGEVNRWTVALTPVKGIWDGKTTPDNDQIAQLVTKFCQNVVMQEVAPSDELNFFNRADLGALAKYMRNITFDDVTLERPRFWPRSVQRVPPISASFYSASPGQGDEKVPTVYLTLEFEYHGFQTKTKSWPWGGKERMDRFINFLHQWCPEHVMYGALMSVQSPKHQPDASGDSILTSIPGTDQAPAPNPNVPPVVDLGELEPLVIDLPGNETTPLSSYIVPMAGLLFAVWAFKQKGKK